MRRVLIYGTFGGLGIALLKFVEYQYVVRAYPGEVYGGVLALLFTAVGMALGLRWTRRREVVVVKEVRVRDAGPFVLNAASLAELGLTRREHDARALLAQGLTNAETAAALTIAPRTVDHHVTVCSTREELSLADGQKRQRPR